MLRQVTKLRFRLQVEVGNSDLRWAKEKGVIVERSEVGKGKVRSGALTLVVVVAWLGIADFPGLGMPS